MKLKTVPGIVCVTILIVTGNAYSQSGSVADARQDRPGLLIIAHGAPGTKWNQPILDLGKQVAELNKTKSIFHSVQVAFLEYAQPDAAAGVEMLEASGCTRIVVVPLFIAPSSHSHFDVPAALGLYSSPEILKTLVEEGARIAKPHVPISLTGTLGHGDLLDRFAQSEIAKFSRDPKQEAVIFLAHGCPDHQSLIDNKLRRLATACCGRSGIEHANWAYCAVGQTYLENGLPLIEQTAKEKHRVIVIGLYVAISAASIHQRASKSGAPHAEGKTPVLGDNITFSENSVVSFPETAPWVLETAIQALQGPQRS